MGELTPFGKEIRRLRLEHEKVPRLKDMADALGVSSAFLSSVESGRKSAPSELVDQIGKLFRLDASRTAELHRLARASTKAVQLSLTGTSEKSRELAVTFARRFPSLSEDEMTNFLELLGHEQAKK